MLKNIDFKREWPSAQITIKKLLTQKNVPHQEWHQLFSTTNRITSWVHGGSNKLLKAVEGELNLCVEEAAKTIHNNNQNTELLGAYNQEWSKYNVLIEYFPLPFSCIQVGQSRSGSGLSRSGVRLEAKDDEKPSVVRETMRRQWNERVFDTIKDRLMDTADELVKKERLGEIINSHMVVSVRESFVNYGYGTDDPLKMYTSYFEKRYIDSCREFYSPRAAQILNENGILNYMGYAFEKLNEEDDRAKRYLDNSTNESHQRLIQASVAILVSQFQDQLLKEAQSLIEKNDTHRLRMLYGLLNKTVDGIPPLLDLLGKFIKAEGLNTMRNNASNIVEDCEKYVDQLLEMYTRFSALVSEAFNNDARFLTVRDQAFQEVVNNTEIFRIEVKTSKTKGIVQPESKCPELLANYCDLLLRKSALTKKLSSEDIDKKLDNVLLVLKYVANKDVFMRYHKNHLSRRLILELSADQDKEESVVNKFRDQGMPSDFVGKLTRMLQDIELNKDLSSEFKRSVTNKEHSVIADCINLKILNAAAWSRGRDKCHVSFPSEIDEVIPEMEEFYKAKYNGRKLNWAHNWSSASIAFNSLKGKYELEVSAFQMALLFAWNDRPDEKISLEGLRLATELPDLDLTRTLMSLVMNPKVKEQVVMTDCQPINQKNFHDSTLFWINRDFAIIKGNKPQPRGRVSLVNRINMNQENIDEEAHEEILRLREFRIQEGIVKIMKMRRVMLLIPLHNELVDLLKHMFVPTRRLIKQQIEWLIEQKYLERDDNNPDSLTYIT